MILKVNSLLLSYFCYNYFCFDNYSWIIVFLLVLLLLLGPIPKLLFLFIVYFCLLIPRVWLLKLVFPCLLKVLLLVVLFVSLSIISFIFSFSYFKAMILLSYIYTFYFSYLNYFGVIFVGFWEECMDGFWAVSVWLLLLLLSVGY